MQSELEPGETILHETPANLVIVVSAVRGRLALTNRRLVFEPRRVTSSQRVIVLPVEEISSAERVFVRGMFGGRFVRALDVGRRNGDPMRFFVRRPMRWCKALAPFIQI